MFDDKAMAALRYELATFVRKANTSRACHLLDPTSLISVKRRFPKGRLDKRVFREREIAPAEDALPPLAGYDFHDGATARSLVPSFPKTFALLRGTGHRRGRSGGRLAAAGALPSGTTDNVRLTILSIFLRAVGPSRAIPTSPFLPVAALARSVRQGKKAVEASGKPFERELNNLYVSGPIARAVMASDANFAASEAEAKQLLKAQFPPQPSDITTEQFLLVAKEALLRAGKGRLPCTLLILDEAQQYIGDSQQRAVAS